MEDKMVERIGLDDAQELLFTRLREWRKDEAEKLGVPVYIVATNSQLREVALRNPQSLESLRSIKGFGKKKIEKHGKNPWTRWYERMASFFEDKFGPELQDMAQKRKGILDEREFWEKFPFH